MFFSGILGMNARNLSFIKKYNGKDATIIADNKLKTKAYLSKIGVPFAKTYLEIKNYEELKSFSLESIGEQSFVIKPNKGSKGKGILIIEKRDGKIFHSGVEYTPSMILRHMQDILDGAYSISGFSDTVVIEEKLIPHHDFQDFCNCGLADIRLIVFNFVPVAAMVRVPTVESEGKANLSQGGIGMGIDIGSGKISSLQLEGSVYTHDFPDKFGDFFMKQIPFWDHILQFSSQIQGHVNLGYLALDWVITQDGPKLLEINARAGLEIQNVTGVPLKGRLQRIKDIKITDYQKGVSIAKSLFSNETHQVIDSSNSLYLSQLGTLSFKDEKKMRTLPVTVRIDTQVLYSSASSDIIALLKKKSSFVTIDNSNITFTFSDIKEIDDTASTSELILGTKDIQNYIIKPIHKYQSIDKYFNKAYFFGVQGLDYKISKIGKQLNISYYIKPTNMLEERTKFIAQQGQYNPLFTYQFPDDVLLDSIEKELLLVQSEIKELKIEKRVSRLFEEKVWELFSKLGLLRAYSSQNYEKIDKYQKILYGETQENLLKICEKKIELQKNVPDKAQVLGKLLSEEEVISKIKEKLVEYSLPDTEINIREENTARISITTGKVAKINIKKGLKIYEKELNAVIAHEIGVHLRRFVNGTRSELRILKHGTAFYLEDEEGLAIYNSLRYLPQNYEKNDMYIKYYLVENAYKYTFSSLGSVIQSIYPRKTLEEIFSDCLRLKKGIVDTSISGKRGISYDKDKIYLNGYEKIKKWVEGGGYIENLMVGKIKIKDIEDFTD